ncbi:MAG: Rne/Rng family ribonuclease [Rhizobiaceae bacterium]
MPNNKMLIDAGHPEETRVVMVRGNRVDEFDFESEHKTQLRGNIYLAKVTRVEPSLQAAFVDYGGNRHGFLAFSEIHPDYYQIPIADRQALLDAEAEDARQDAAADALDDQDDQDENVESSDSDEAGEKDAKPARKRRSRRRGKKATEATADVESSSEESQLPESEQANDAVDQQESEQSADSSVSDEQAEIRTTEDQGEESDDDDTIISAENDGDDVVSEEAKDEKPKRKPTRRPRKKKADASPDAEDAVEMSDSETEAAVEAEANEQSEEDPKPKRRRTSRPKASAAKSSNEVVLEPSSDESPSPDSAAENGLVTEAASEAVEDEPKPKRRRTSRKKKSPDAALEAEAASTDDADSAIEENEGKMSVNGNGEEDTAEAKPARTRKTRPRRSRKRKATDATSDEADGDSAENDENAESVEALGAEDALEEVPARRAPRRHYKIQEVIKRRQILLVQVVKEERGNKGAALTTYLSLAGRYSVLMPNTARGGGISRKITNTSDRKRLKSIAANLEVPQGMGVILRTAGASRKPDDIQRDFEYLMRLWENVRSLTLESTAPFLVYEEGSLIKRSIRDLYDNDTGEILVAGEDGYREAKDFMTMLMPNHAKNVKLYRDRIPMFARMGVEAQLDAMLQPQVTLKSGGYLIIDQTEALVAIDVNSGRSTRQHSIEETATQTNLEAADEVARQLRLRDLAGLIVIDFIDMEEKRNIRLVEKRLKDALKNDRARIQVGRISHFGLMEMSRQRIRASVLESTTQVCPTCEGLGHVRAPSSIVISVLRSIEEQLNRNARNNLTVKVSTETALYLLNNKRENLGDLESRFNVTISVATDESLGNTPCVIERGEVSRRTKAPEAPIQPDSIDPESEIQIESEVTTASDQSEQSAEGDAPSGGKKRRRRRRRRKSGAETENTEVSASDESSEDSADAEPLISETQETSATEDKTDTPKAEPAENNGRTKRTRRTRRTKSENQEADDSPPPSDNGSSAAPSTASGPEDTVAEKPKRTRRKKAKPAAIEEAESATSAASDVEPAPANGLVNDVEATGGETTVVTKASEPDRPRRRTTRRKKSDEQPADSLEPAASPDAESTPEVQVTSNAEPEAKKGGWWQRKFF